MIKIVVWLFQLPYHFDRTGVRVMAMCPGVTDTPLVSECFRRMLRKDWGEELKRDLGELPQQKWVLVIMEWPFLQNSYTSDFPWYCGCKRLQLHYYAENYFRFVRARLFKNTLPTKWDKSSGSEVWEEPWAANCDELDCHNIILCNILSFANHLW
jgi:hypothetical protein